jgi:hypothetical protein
VALTVSENIRAYGELQYIEGYYTGLFKELEELCDEIEDMRAALDVMKLLDKLIKDNVDQERYEVLKVHIDHISAAILHNFYKKTDRYGKNS